MEIKVVQGEITKFAGGALVLPVFEEESALATSAAAVDAALEGNISQLIKNSEIRGQI